MPDLTQAEGHLIGIPVLWTIDPLDWCSSNVGCITERVVNKAGENEIILMHDYYDTSVTAALKVVDELLEAGYMFVTVDEILFEGSDFSQLISMDVG